MALLAIAVLATAAGMRGYAGFATWAATASDDVLAQVGVRFRRPSEKTFRAVLSRLDPPTSTPGWAVTSLHTWPAATPVDWCRSRWTARCCVVLYAPKRQPRISCRCSPTVPDWCSVNSLSPRKAMKFPAYVPCSRCCRITCGGWSPWMRCIPRSSPRS
ncbi:DDE_Tnp_1-associated family protein [Mycobacterium ulcerans str. Harvey]|uniref:DDE_Tnp_1-associated family protein n=1 Tax=Mycobacterium ulcerans str. Harvey TaxID=1299332 RepID=A0ABP3AKT5_MYCUL|nr:DDE_Tnp_1-associated family protein [Mycobacterium ulcerans str. Harvey]